MKKCKKCGNKLGFFVSNDYCDSCLNQYPELRIQQEQIRQQGRTELLNKLGKAKYPQLYEGKETVVLLAEGDTGLQLAVQYANAVGYELINTSSSMSMWTPMTKYTLIFKKKKD